MMYTYYIAIELLIALGFVPNKRNPGRHHASVTIAGYTVWATDYYAALKIANRVMRALKKRGLYPKYKVEDEFDSMCTN